MMYQWQRVPQQMIVITDVKVEIGIKMIGVLFFLSCIVELRPPNSESGISSLR
jgi:hypothetical protein